MRLLIVLCLWFGTFPLSIGNAQQPAAAGRPSRPNFVFIMADDLGWADVAFHSGSAPTPHLDMLLQEGCELTQHYVAPVCSPTRAGLLTGRCWSRFNVTTPTNSRGLPWDTMTLPQALKQVGYETCLAGKWHLGSMPEWGPNRFGFDHAYGSLAGGVSPWNHFYKKGPYTRTWHRNGELLDETGHVTDLLTSEAVGWIKSRGDAPFFLYVPYTAIHLPLKEPRQWVERAPTAIQGDVARHYAASIMHLDDAVGQIVAALEECNFKENTLLVFTSDNGGSLAENNDLKYPDDNCPNGRLPGNNRPLRGNKGSLYEGGTRVPTIVSWPAMKLPPRISTPVQIVDWMPTFCHLAGYQSDRNLKWDGQDLSSGLTAQASIPSRPLYTVGPSWRGRSLRFGDWKLIELGTGDKRTLELYNLANDESESTDLAASEPERVAQMLELMADVSISDKDAVVGD